MKTFRCPITIFERSVCYYEGEIVCLMKDRNGAIGMYDDDGMVGFNEENNIRQITDCVINDVNFKLRSTLSKRENATFKDWRSQHD